MPLTEIKKEIEVLGLGKSHHNFSYQVEKHGACRAGHYVSRGKNFDHLIQYDEVISINDFLKIDPNFKDITVEDNHNYLCGDGSYYNLHNCGTGFSVQRHHVDKLPDFHITKSTDLSEEKIYKIDDSIEGWSDALGVLTASYIPHSEFSDFHGKKVTFDYSAIRPKGSSLSYGVGKAPGHEPLERSLEKIRELLNKSVDAGNKKLRTIDAYDIIMHASDAVLSGGIRRSACLAMFSVDDELMLNAKIGDGYEPGGDR